MMRSLQDASILNTLMFASCFAWTPYKVNPDITSADEAQWATRGWCLQNPPKLDKLEYKGAEYEFQLAQGIWQSPQPVASAIKYFLEEQLNIKVKLLAGSSSQDILQAIANCSDLARCQQETVQSLDDVEAYPPPAWAAAEVWTSAPTENFLATTFTDILGSVGYRTYPGMYMYRRTFESADANNYTIRWYENLRYPEALQYFTKLSALDAKLRNVTGCAMPDGSNSCAPQCVPGDEYYDGSFGDYRSDCDSRGWWLAPACRSDPEKCIPVVLWVPYWNAKEMAEAAIHSNLPLAITWLWFVGAGLRAIPELSVDPQINFLFYWWGTDRTFGSQMSGRNAPLMVNFAQEQKPKLLDIDQVQLPDIVVWKHLKRVDEVIYDAWKRISIPQGAIDTMLDDVANGKSASDIACAWMLSESGTQVWNAWMPDLSDCRMGFYYNASASARDKCAVCRPGTFTNERGQTECDACPAGTYQSEAGKNKCLKCYAGYYSTGGAELCTQCPAGTYSAAISSSSCQSCEHHLKGSKTISPGSTSPLQCVCAEGNYMPLRNLACKPCPVGMICPIGSEESGFFTANSTIPVPTLDVGYWSSKQEPLFIYACKPGGGSAIKGTTSSCPGGKPETCTIGRLGLACGLCPDGSTREDEGCKTCAGSEAFTAVLGMLVLMLLPVLLYPGVNAPHQWKVAPREALVVTCEVTFELLQVCAAITFMTIDWPGIAVDLVAVMEVFQFEIADFFPLSCLFPLSRDVPVYIAGCSMIPAMVFMTILWYPLCSKVLPRIFSRFPRWDFPGTFNLCGKIVNLLFISQVMLSMMPLQCYSHPNGESSSIREFPSTLCGSHDHHVMLVVGLASLLSCLAGFVYLIWELFRAPRRLKDPDHDSYLKRITFIVEDFKLSRFWWNVVAKLQELFLGFVILFDPNNTRIQLAIFMIIFVCSLYLWTRHWPYKLPLLSVMSSVIFGILVLVLLLGTTSLEVSNAEEDEFSRELLTFLLIGTFATFVVTLILVSTNLLVRGTHGELFAFMHMQKVPPVKELLKYWQDVTRISKDEMQVMIGSWEHHERKFLHRVLVQLHVPGVGSRYTNAFRCSGTGSEELSAVLERWNTRLSGSMETQRPSGLMETQIPSLLQSPKESLVDWTNDMDKSKELEQIMSGFDLKSKRTLTFEDDLRSKRTLTLEEDLISKSELPKTPPPFVDFTNDTGTQLVRELETIQSLGESDSSGSLTMV